MELGYRPDRLFRQSKFSPERSTRRTARTMTYHPPSGSEWRDRPAIQVERRSMVIFKVAWVAPMHCETRSASGAVGDVLVEPHSTMPRTFRRQCLEQSHAARCQRPHPSQQAHGVQRAVTKRIEQYSRF
jgi:hypothetical protein